MICARRGRGAVWRAGVLLLLGLALFGCASDRVHREGLVLLEEGKEEAGLAKLEEAYRQQPSNIGYRADLMRARSQALQRLVNAGQAAQAGGRGEQAAQYYRRALAIDANNASALAGLAALERDKRHAQALAKAVELENQGDVEGAERLARAVLLEEPNDAPARALLERLEAQRANELRATPLLKPKIARAVSFEFREAALKLVFDALSRTSGINFLLDRDVKGEAKVSVVLREVHVEDAIELILMQNQLSMKILSENAVLVYPPQKERDYQDLMVKNFYLTNANVKETVNMLKSVLKAKDVYVDESLNLVIMRDTPEALRLAGKLIAAHDLAEPEVMLEMDLIEISRSRLLELGIQWTDQYTFGVVDTTGDPFVISDLKNLSSSTISMTPPAATATARKTQGDANTLLNPRIRVRNREKARLVVADRLPVISSVVTSGSGNPVVTDSVQYIEVGLKLEVQPSVHLDGKVSITVNLEVSNLGEEVRTRNGTVAYRVGTRNAQTVLSMADGQTQILSGLISDSDRSSATKIPGLGDVPLLGRLFGVQSDDDKKLEILLAITPHVVHNLARPEARIAEFWSGSEATLRTRPMTLRTVAAAPTPNGRASAAPHPGAPAAEPSPAEPDALPLAGATRPDAAPAMPPASSGEVTALLRGPAQAKVGDTFSVALWVRSAQSITAMTAQLAFDPALLEAVAVTEGAFLNRDGALTAFDQRIDPTGQVLLRGVRTAPGGVAGEGPLASITFRVKQASPAAQISVRGLSSMGANDQALAGTLPPPLGLPLTP